ncbi:MAG: hypothetical protein HKN49_13135 [Gammaproteobacteria bacterium]|nr:hypothetical protein [Gammaproteobacteria bacterium]
MSRTVLAIDQGGQSTRACLFDGRGNLLAAARRSISTRRDGQLRVEHDPDELADSVDSVCREVLANGPDADVAALATQRSSVVCWDRITGEALSPVLSWQDRRAGDLLARYAPSGEVIADITGLVASPHYGASKLRWCLENLPAVARAAGDGRLALGPVASFLLFRNLAGSPLVCDPVNASRTLLWNVSSGDWSTQLTTAFGVPKQFLPVCVGNRAAFGTLQSVPLEVCTGDQAAAVFAHGQLQTNRVYINIGTGAFLLAPVDALPASSQLLRSVAWVDDSQRSVVLEGTVNGAASALSVVQPSTATGDIDSAAASLGNADDLPFFLNGVSGIGSPHWVAHMPSRFIGEGDKAAQLTAVLESILFLLQDNLVEIPDWEQREIIVSGGLARADGLCQGLADLSGRVVWRSAQAEATISGLARLAAGLPGNWPIAESQRFNPQPGSKLPNRYRQWQRLLTEEIATLPL